MLRSRLLLVVLLSSLFAVSLQLALGVTSAVTTIWAPAALSVIAGYGCRWPGVFAAGSVTFVSLLLFRHQIDGVAIVMLSLQQALIAVGGHCYRNTVSSSGYAISVDTIPSVLQKQGWTALAAIAAGLCGVLAAIYSEVFSSAPVAAALALFFSSLLAILLILPVVLSAVDLRRSQFLLLSALIVGVTAVPVWVSTPETVVFVVVPVVWLLAGCFSLYCSPGVPASFLVGLAMGSVLAEMVWPHQFGLAVQMGLIVLALFVLLITHKLLVQRVVQLQQNETIDRRSSRVRYLLNQRDEVTALAVHDLQSPIQSIGGLLKTLLHMIERKSDDPVQVQSALRSAIGSLEEMSHRVASVLSETRPHLGGNATRYNLGGVISQVVAAHQVEISERQLEVERVDDSTLIVNDAEEVKDILDVLLDNSIQHSPDNGVISIESRIAADAKNITVEISDDGSGVNPAEIGNLFQVGASSGGRQGIGLYLAYQRARSIGGAIHYIEGGAPGACFRVTLAIAK